ncbi:MAG: nitrous oxide reductase family maturation protein NosD [Rhodospirillaceae bacterium]|nr:nitrous oxide reductase family maturation protein NosD [Rhodospirillales bacterium]
MRLAIILAAAAFPAAAATIDVPPGDLAAAVAAAQPGDLLRLAAGRHNGPVVVDKALTLEGVPGAVVDGGGHGRVIQVSAPDVTVRGLEITGSGLDLEAMDAGVFLDKAAVRAVVDGNRMLDNLVGVYVWGAADAKVTGNVVVGRQDLRVNERGNGISLWNAPGAEIMGNRVSHGRDGIFVVTSKRNKFVGNHFDHVRFAIHYMYCDNSEVSGNVSEGNYVGYALMYSTGLKVVGNTSRGDSDHGVLLNYTNSSEITGNRVGGGEKCVFIYNANKNRIADNVFQGCGIGIHFTAGSERNRLSGNAFIANQTQVKYVGTRDVEWAEAGRGNYWSDNPAFDLNGDGIADTAYRPNDVVDQIVWAVPLAKVLLNSPAVQVVRWSQAQFPALTPGGVVDPAPLMRAP